LSGVRLTIDIEDLIELGEDLEGISNRAKDCSVPMKIAAQILEASVIQNFEAGGRPSPWTPLAESTLLAKAPKRKALIDSGRLFDSITSRFDAESAGAGTNVVYAAVHQFGHKFDKTVDVPEHERRISRAFGKPIAPKTVTVRAHKMKMNTEVPARPFLLAQEEDIGDIKQAIIDYLRGG